MGNYAYKSFFWKLILPLFISLSFIACRKPTIELNFDDKDIPVKIAENLTGDSNCDFDSNLSSCTQEFALIDLCIECTACLTDDRLKEHRTVEIFIEGLPRRDAQKIATVTTGPNYDFKETICVPVIEGQESQIIGFSIKKEMPGFPVINDFHSYVVYDNITLKQNGTTKYHKDIVGEDLWDNQITCSVDDLIIVWEREPIATEEFTIDYTYCIVGSIGDCNTVSIPRTDFDLESELEEIKAFYQTGLRYIKYPCSGIYVSF